MTKQLEGNQVRRDFYRLALDWVHLRSQMPTPAHSGGRSAKYREYGHPAQWASDRAAEIAGVFHSWHDLLSEHRHEKPPPPRTAAEQVRVVRAWQYLEPRFDMLVELVDAEALGEIGELHRRVGHALGFNRPHEVLPVPCPGSECGLLTLTRTIAVGRDYISCGTCGYTVVDDADGKNYRWLARVILNTLIDAA